MTCNEFRDRVEDLLDGLLPPEEGEHLDVHRDGCADCSAQWVEAGKFRDLLAREGRAALGAWEARRLVVRAAAQLPGEPGAPQIVRGPRRRFTVLRLAAAASIVAAAAILGSGLLGESGPVVLAQDVETRLDPGTEATFGHDCRLVVEDRATTVTLRRGANDPDGSVIDMERGVALFRVHPEHALGVVTVQGVARAVGATFVIDVRTDGAVAVDVVTGRVRLERDDAVVVARSGERVEVDRNGAAHVVSRARIDELEVQDGRRADEIDTLSAELERLQQQVDAYAAAAHAGGNLASAGGELPYEELGRTMRTLTDRAVPFSDPRRNEAMAFFLLNAERIKQEFGATDPFRALEKPAFVAAVSHGYLAALAPEASETALAAAVDGIRAACARVEAEAAQSPLPTELACGYQRALVDIIRTVDTHLGATAAAEVVMAFRGAWDGARPTVQSIDDRLEARMVSFWQKAAALDDDQTNRLADLVRAYIAETISVQAQVAAALTAEEAERVLFPRGFGNRFSGNGGASGRRAKGGERERGSWDEDHDESERTGPWRGDAEGRPERSASEIVSDRLRELDARLHLAAPRRLYERGLANMLTEEQHEKAFRGPPRLFTFRARTTASEE